MSLLVSVRRTVLGSLKLVRKGYSVYFTLGTRAPHTALHFLAQFIAINILIYYFYKIILKRCLLLLKKPRLSKPLFLS